MQRNGLSTALEDARAAVQRSDDGQLKGHSYTRKSATLDETRALRDALRALIQAVEAIAAALPGKLAGEDS